MVVGPAGNTDEDNTLHWWVPVVGASIDNADKYGNITISHDI